MMAKNLSPNEFKLNFNLASALRMSALKEHQDEAKKLIKVAEDNMPKGQESQLKPLIEKWHNGEGIIVL
jgi:hypothetical protein